MVKMVTIAGRRWRVHFSPRLYSCDGACDLPTVAGKTITISDRLRGRRKLEVVLHEFLHAGLWSLDEGCVDELARDIAVALWRLGYRGPDGDSRHDE